MRSFEVRITLIQPHPGALGVPTFAEFDTIYDLVDEINRLMDTGRYVEAYKVMHEDLEPLMRPLMKLTGLQN